MSELTVNEKEFLDSIKNICQLQMRNTGVPSSVIAALLFDISDGGVSNSMTINTNNYAKMLIGTGYQGKCYDAVDAKIYDNKDEYEGTSALYKVYDSVDDCIEDYVYHLLNERKMENGPFKYGNIKKAGDNIEKILDILDKNDYQKNYLFRRKDNNWKEKVLNIIETAQLVEWDNEVNEDKVNFDGRSYFVKKAVDDLEFILVTHNLDIAKKTAKENGGYKVFDDLGNCLFDEYTIMENLYRVKFNNNQLMVTPDLAEAKEEAEKHGGYKVYDHQDNLIYDPWDDNKDDDKKIQEMIDSVYVKPVYVVYPGKEIHAVNVPVYTYPGDKNPTFYLENSIIYCFDNNIINDCMVRVSRTNDIRYINGKDPSKVIGYINLGDI